MLFVFHCTSAALAHPVQTGHGLTDATGTCAARRWALRTIILSVGNVYNFIRLGKPIRLMQKQYNVEPLLQFACHSLHRALNMLQAWWLFLAVCYVTFTQQKQPHCSTVWLQIETFLPWHIVTVPTFPSALMNIGVGGKRCCAKMKLKFHHSPKFAPSAVTIACDQRATKGLVCLCVYVIFLPSCWLFRFIETDFRFPTDQPDDGLFYRFQQTVGKNAKNNKKWNFYHTY